MDNLLLANINDTSADQLLNHAGLQHHNCCLLLRHYKPDLSKYTVSFQTDRSRQTVQTNIRLLLEEQSDQCLHCLLFHLHLFDKIP